VQIDKSKVHLHFIVCIERTGSSMLSAMINSHPELLSTSEEPFALYFSTAYRNKNSYTSEEIKELVERFRLTAEKNIQLYFSPLEELENSLLRHKDNLPFNKLCELIYLHFIPLKPKEKITHIIDKQIKFILYIDKLSTIFPGSKFIILVRDYHDVIASWRKRGLASGRKVAYIASVWNLSYKKALVAFKQNPEKIKIIRYEDLVTNPEQVLRNIADHFGFVFHKGMIDHHLSFNFYLESMQGKVSEEFLKKLRDFHSNTLSPVNKDLIGDWKNKLNEKEISIIENICGKTGNNFGYEIPGTKKYRLSLTEYFSFLRAKSDKLIYLNIYVIIPLWLKKIIKKLRPNKIQE